MKNLLSKSVLNTLSQIYESHSINTFNTKKNCVNILNLSDTYKDQHKDHSDIWDKSSFLSAYLLYFFPLNILRVSSVINEVFKYLKVAPKVIYDYGCGPGTLQLALQNNNISLQKLIASDSSTQAVEIYKSWCKDDHVSIHQQTQNSIEPNSLAVFSYSLNEMPELPENLFKHEHILIIEPSTQKMARQLQSLREVFMDHNYNVIAPCTHQLACPLLTHSKKDWCHHRISVELPIHLKKIEQSLPIKNKTLTYSYLFISKSLKPNKNENTGRLIGDLLIEKGKTRQAYCRNDQREFLTQLKRHKLKANYKRGDLVKVESSIVKKENELRMQSDSDIKILD